MATRPDDWMVEVELVEDDGPSTLVPPSDRAASDQEPAVEPDAPAAHRRELPRRARQVVGGLAALGVLVVGVPIALDLADQSDSDATRVSLERPLGELWVIPGGTVQGAADGVLAVLPDGKLSGYDEVTGEERWLLPLGQPGGVDRCGGAITTDPGILWCWRNRQGVVVQSSGEELLQEAAIVGVSMADGTVVVEHEVRVPSAGMVAVDGDLVVGDRVGAVLTLRRVEPEQWRDKWTTQVDLLPRLDLTQYQAAIEQVAGFVVVHGPMVAVVDPENGRVLGTWPPVDDPFGTGIEGADLVVTDHGFAASTAVLDSVRLPQGVWYDAQGAEVVELNGTLAEPSVSDGSEPGVVLAYQSEGTLLAGVDIANGDDLWTYPLDGGEALVRQDGTVVVTRGESEVTSLGLLDGQVKWTAEVDGLRADAGGLSDGKVVIVMAVQGRGWVLEAFAVATGERLWFADAPGTPDLNELFFAGPPPRLELIGDRPVVRSGNALTWLG